MIERKGTFANRADSVPDTYAVARRRMVTEQLIPGGIRDSRVLEVMGRVKRHAFVSPGMEDQAYMDRPLPIGLNQTISQPLMVAIMTEALALEGREKVLEIGTGSGYQAAILAEMAGAVCTVERITDLSIRARKVLYRLGYENIKLRIGDGTLGWPEEAPFDGIIVTAGAPVVPEALMAQLSDGGRLVIPVGGEEMQRLDVITRRGDGFDTRSVTACRFVKLIGREGWHNEG
ncbi:MAG: protein-L-isoaspartate(D-aspartate) O-methyltransferase [Proteobacteria bacterium]|nr:protein-L-isoaspartate(D-aspartate) O-methyltransferase [Pseudomonadota bacterium]